MVPRKTKTIPVRNLGGLGWGGRGMRFIAFSASANYGMIQRRIDGSISSIPGCLLPFSCLIASGAPNQSSTPILRSL